MPEHQVSSYLTHEASKDRIRSAVQKRISSLTLYEAIRGQVEPPLLMAVYTAIIYGINSKQFDAVLEAKAI